MNCEKRIRELYDSLENKRSILNILRSSENKELVEYLNKKYPMLKDKKYSTGMKIYWLVNGFDDFPKCKECGGPNKTHRCYIDGYATEFCSRKCANGEHKKEAMRKTFIKHYGVDNPLKDEEIKKRQIETISRKYNVDNISKLSETVDKIKKTKLERYGDENYVNSEKAKVTNIEKYGSENPFGNEEVQKKARMTMLSKYGVSSPMHIDEIRERVSAKSTAFSIHNSYTNYLMTNPYSEPAFSEEFYYEHRGENLELEFKCRKCGGIYLSKNHNGHIRRCPKCYPSVTTSGKEQEIFDYIRSIYSGKVVRKDRSVLGDGKEIDIYVPDRKVAFEFDGLYWHSELNGIGRGYHLAKTKAAAERGVQLIHIFEDEWDVRQDITKSRIANMLGVCQRTVYARKCSIVKPTEEQEADFLERNHIQGKVRSCACYGLEYNGELVSLMSFSAQRTALGRKPKEGAYELLRFCSLVGVRVVGAAGRLLSAFEREYQPKELITYADRRWSVGNLYERIGFSLDHVSSPNYWYLNNGCDRREHRYAWRKSVLSQKLKVFDPRLTEAENMRRNKYTRIWDCGNLVFVKKYN